MSATLEILRSGPLSLIEDLGRPGLAHMGVSRSGAADRRSHTLANRLVANPGEFATIEVTFGGLTARVRGGDEKGVRDRRHRSGHRSGDQRGSVRHEQHSPTPATVR